MRRKTWLKRTCASFVWCAAAAIAAGATTFTILVNFNGTNGIGPTTPIQAADGNFYGTTSNGGANGWGTVFKITPMGALTTVYSFCSQTGCTDGAGPDATLELGTDGNFYGVTYFGGVDTACTYGCGTIFKLTPKGTLTTLHSFDVADGENPVAPLSPETNGAFYGTMGAGGANGYGTLFKITPKGAFTTLYNFCNQTDCTDGASPDAGLALGTDGNLYGTTAYGGAHGAGTVFKATLKGAITTLYSCCSLSNCTDGGDPTGVALGRDGNFYGTAGDNGAYGGGTVFKITPSGMLSTLYSFCSQSDCTDGANPDATLELGTDGNFYGTTFGGGTGTLCFGGGCGTIFKITTAGVLTTLHDFDFTDGWNIVDGLFQATNGSFYAGANDSGDSGDGNVYRLTVGLGPFVEALPAAGKVGTRVSILGTNLTRATSVTFNGTPAAYKVVAASLITTTVPAGATSGKVEVVTPKQALFSNVAFRVLP